MKDGPTKSAFCILGGNESLKTDHLSVNTQKSLNVSSEMLRLLS